LSYTANAQVGGKLAQIGSRLVDGAARKIAGEFFKRFSAQLTKGDEPEGESEDGPDQAAADGEGEVKKGKRSWTAWISKS
jgi:hypothetical protein